MAESVANRHDQLDYLRGMAALMVLIHHVCGAFYSAPAGAPGNPPALLDQLSAALLQLTSFGFEAVVLFFVLSGYAMAHSVSQSTSRSRFYLKRIVRLWPPYVAACLLAAAVAAAFDYRFNLLASLFYIAPGRSQVTPPFWSLPFEVVFYILCPVVLASAARIRALFALSVVMLIATVAARGWSVNPWPHFSLNFLGNELFLFASGAMAFLYVRKVPGLTPRMFRLAVVAALGIAWIGKRWLGDLNVLSMLVITAVSILAIVNVRVVPRLNFGFFSYSLYLFHFPLIIVATQALLSFGFVGTEIRHPLAWIPLAAASGIACLGLYWSTERISNQWVAGLRRTPEPPPTAAERPARWPDFRNLARSPAATPREQLQSAR